MPDSDALFITGFPGFIASRLLKRLAKREGNFVLLVQPALAGRAKEEITKIGAENGRAVSNFRLVEGDISQTNLGLAANDLSLVRSETTRIFHLAAVYDLAVFRELALSVNVEGTRNWNN